MDFNNNNKAKKSLNFRNTPSRSNLSNRESQINSTPINNPSQFNNNAPIEDYDENFYETEENTVDEAPDITHLDDRDDFTLGTFCN